MNIPLLPIRSLVGTSIFSTPKEVGKKAAVVKSPFSDEEICVVPAIKPDVGFIHVQRTDEEGNGWHKAGPGRFRSARAGKLVLTVNHGWSEGSRGPNQGVVFPTPDSKDMLDLNGFPRRLTFRKKGQTSGLKFSPITNRRRALV